MEKSILTHLILIEPLYISLVIELTPLHRAASSGHLNVEKVLIEAGADSSAGDEFGETALDKAEVFESEEIVLFLKNL